VDMVAARPSMVGLRAAVGDSTVTSRTEQR